MLILHKGKIISEIILMVYGTFFVTTHKLLDTKNLPYVQSNNINILTALVIKVTMNWQTFFMPVPTAQLSARFKMPSTLIFSATWQGIDKLNMKYLITDHTNIALGHLDQERKNVQSTKVTSDFSCTHNILIKIIPFSAKEMSYGDLTGAFPYTSSRGHKYLYVMCVHDSNGILVVPLKNRNSATIVTAWKSLFNKFTKHGHTTKMFVLGNEFSRQLKDTLTKAHLNFQLVPPHVH